MVRAAVGSLAQLTLVAHRRVDGDVALLSSETFAADTASSWVADEIIIGALAMFHAMRAVIAFRTNFVALRTHPAIRASTLSIVGATRSVMLTSTSLRAGNSPCVDRTWNRTVIAFPSGQTSTLTSDVMTFSAVLAAVAFVTAGETEGSFRAGLLAADALVTRSARALTVFGVTQPVTEDA